MNLESRAGGATGALSANIAAWTNTFAQTGKDVVDTFEEFKKGFENIADSVKKAAISMGETRKGQDEAAKALKESADSLNGAAKVATKAAATLAEMASYRGFIH